MARDLAEDEVSFNKIKSYNKAGRLQQSRVMLVSESGFYKIALSFQASNPKVKAFKDWVTRDVLPAIRKDGGYVMGEEKVASIYFQPH